MMNNKILFVTVSALIVVGAILVITQGKASRTMTTNELSATETTYRALDSADLYVMLADKDFALIDVHTPEQKHVPGTDALISYTDIDKIVKAFPDTNQKIVLYCRSGNMSKIAAQELIDRGYANVYDLTNGMNEWLGQDRETIPVGAVPVL